jgi:glucose dehydrogenase
MVRPQRLTVMAPRTALAVLPVDREASGVPGAHRRTAMLGRPPQARGAHSLARSLRVGPLVSLVLLLGLSPSGCGSSGCDSTRVSSAPASFCAGDWPQFRFIPSHTGFNAAETTLSLANVGKLTRFWSRPISGGEVSSSPAVVQGMVYVGSGDGKVYALYGASGAVKWTRALGSGTDASPAVAFGVVYISFDSGNESFVAALVAATGAVKWTRPVGLAATSSPAVDNGLVYVGASAGDGVNLQGPGVYGLDAATGAVKWTTQLAGVVYSSPAVANGLVYIGSDHNVYALDAANGAIVWTGRIAPAGIGDYAFPASSPAVSNGVVYIGSNDGRVYAFH